MRKVLYIITIFVIFALIYYIYTLTTYTYITAKFGELRPLHEHLHVYYKGIIIGEATEKIHSKDFQHTLMKITLKKKNILLPENIVVLLKKEKRNDKEHDFLELIYPQNPSSTMISNGSTIKGIATVDIDTFMSNQHPDDLEKIKQNLTQSTENLEAALAGLSELFILLQDVVKDNEKNLKTSSKNLANTTQNLDNITEKINSTIKEDSLNKTMQNLDSAIQNLHTITSSLNTTTDSFNIAMPRVDATLYEVHEIASNANAISCGIRQTLSKRFGGLRLLFGQTIQKCH